MLIMTLMLWAAGCSDKGTQPETSPLPNLEDEFGGYTATAEAVGFGDPEILEEEDGELVYSDPMLSSPPVDSIVNDPAAGLFHLRAVWGRLCYDSTVEEITDWTGSLSISRGAVILRRVIRFEPPGDRILPRTDRRIIEWESFTTVHNDGIAIDLFVPPPRPVFDTTITIVDETDTIITVVTVWPEPVTVKFDTGPYSRTFTLGELASLDTIVQLDDSNAVAFHAIQVHPALCPRGFLFGRWGYDEDGQGVFKGLWADQRGFVFGHVRGHFGKNENGHRVFFGKWIDRLGQFKGFIRGSWGPRPGPNVEANAALHAGGWFRGRIYNADRVEIGVLKGRYRGSMYYRGGFFQGRWKLHCGIRPDDTAASDILDDGF